jgi:hypothetical protein
MNRIENRELFNVQNISTKYGLAGGLITFLLLLIINSLSTPTVLSGILTIYVPMGIIVLIALNVLKRQVSSRLFGKGARLSFKISLIAALIVAVLSLVIYVVVPSLAFQNFGRETTSTVQALEVASMLFFEIMVFTNLMAFIVLQYLKRRVEL